MDSEQSSSSQGKLCCACGEPPRVAAAATAAVSEGGNVVIPLKRCSRCRQVWYHDLACQKNHFPKHKKECRQWAGSVVPVTDDGGKTNSQTRNLKVRVEARPSRGNCLVASETIRKQERIISGSGGDNSWSPLVPPVLLESQRWSRCTFCFKKLEAPTFRYDENTVKGNQHPYPLLFCSEECRYKGRDVGFDKEELAVIRLYERRGAVRIFSTAILLYRIYFSARTDSSKDVAKQVERLQCKIPQDGASTSSSHNADDPSYQHSQAVMATVVAMLQVSGDFGMFVPPSTDMEDMVNRIKINGFSIADGESIAMGIGIYSIPSFMNHSCRPNTVQTFLYGHNLPPSLFLTSYDDINAGEEILISYLDNSCPRHLRRQRLLSDYFFSCGCDACADSELESQIMGVKCPRCHDTQRPVQVVENLAPAPRLLRCIPCQNMDFSNQIRSLELFEQLESNADISTLDRLYKDLKQVCLPGSWYVQESGDRLVHAFLEKLGQTKTIQEQEEYAKRSLVVLQELLSHVPTWNTSSREFRGSIQWFQEAKLRLFLEPDPRSAIQLLEKALRMLSFYYPRNHELLQNLSTSLIEARM